MSLIKPPKTPEHSESTSQDFIAAPAPKPIKSDGGSSSYYTLKIKGRTVEAEDVINEVFDNDFDLGNMFKSLVRIQSAIDGKGKAGTSPMYDLNKIIYTATKLKERWEGRAWS